MSRSASCEGSNDLPGSKQDIRSCRSVKYKEQCRLADASIIFTWLEDRAYPDFQSGPLAPEVEACLDCLQIVIEIFYHMLVCSDLCPLVFKSQLSAFVVLVMLFVWSL